MSISFLPLLYLPTFSDRKEAVFVKKTQTKSITSPPPLYAGMPLKAVSILYAFLQNPLVPVVSKNQQTIPARVRLLGPTISIPMTKQAASIPAIANPANTRVHTKLYKYRKSYIKLDYKIMIIDYSALLVRWNKHTFIKRLEVYTIYLHILNKEDFDTYNQISIYIYLLRGQNERLQYKSLLNPSRINASTQICLLAFKSDVSISGCRRCSPSARIQGCSVQFSFSCLRPRFLFWNLQNDFSPCRKKKWLFSSR